MRIVAFACMGVLLAACGGSSDHPRADFSAQRADLAAHRALWAERGPRSYQYTYQPRGFAPRQKIEVTVTSGVVSGATLVEGSPPIWSKGATVEALFDEIATWLDGVERCPRGDRCLAQIAYDDTLGHPVSVWIGDDSVLDGVSGWDVSGVTSLN
jgi:hypothetical protein